MRKFILILISGIFISLAIFLWVNKKWLHYAYIQAKGQFEVMYNTREISECLLDSAIADSIKIKLHLVEEIRQFAFDSIGLDRNDNYTRFYDQKGKPIMWMLTATKPFSLEEYQWHFPIIGTFGYKGFFDWKEAQKELKNISKLGYDTDLGEISGWSTLGWLSDPVLSNMLERSEGGLASVLIHELTHGTVFVKDNLFFNENLANFIGHQGAIDFLNYKYKKDSTQLKKYLKRYNYREKYVYTALKTAKILNVIYQKPFFIQANIATKKTVKNKMIRKMMAWADTSFMHMHDSLLPNNCYFMHFMRYDGSQSNFQEKYQKQHQSNLKKYIEFLKKEYN